MPPSVQSVPYYHKFMSRSRQEKLRAMESRRGLNHDQSTLKEWITNDFGCPGFPRSIHVAGTNGKGSVITWLEVLLACQNRSTGSFTSPHLISHNERLRLSGSPISMDEWEMIYDSMEESFNHRQMTMFEMDLFMACSLFVKARPDWVLIETGMGGGRDATTALDYPYGIITHIGLDHMAYLGETKEEIAEAKAGIIKPGMTVVTAETDPACLQIFQKRADECGATLISIDHDAEIDDSLWNPSLPAYQKDNFLCAKTLLEQAGFVFTDQQLADAISRFIWPARFQILRTDPLVLLDGAHNPDGIEALCCSIREAGIVIDQIFFSVLADKQADEMIEMLRRLSTDIQLVRFESERIAGLDELAAKWNLSVINMEELPKKLAQTRKQTLVCGSLYFAGNLLQLIASSFPLQSD